MFLCSAAKKEGSRGCFIKKKLSQRANLFHANNVFRKGSFLLFQKSFEEEKEFLEKSL
jgi:hypothetical protein